jgi:hypothetical protein
VSHQWPVAARQRALSAYRAPLQLRDVIQFTIRGVRRDGQGKSGQMDTRTGDRCKAHRQVDARGARQRASRCAQSHHEQEMTPDRHGAVM